MRFYSLQPSELEKLDDMEIRALQANAVRISARERLEAINALNAAMSGGNESKSYLVALAEQAFGDDDESRALVIESMTRR